MTLTNLYRKLTTQPKPKTAADFCCEIPWQVNDTSGPRKRWMLVKLLDMRRF